MFYFLLRNIPLSRGVHRPHQPAKAMLKTVGGWGWGLLRPGPWRWGKKKEERKEEQDWKWYLRKPEDQERKTELSKMILRTQQTISE